MITSTIRFNFALPGQDPSENSRRHRAAIEMVEVADRAGLTAVSLEEHHGVMEGRQPLGWCAAPIALAAAMLVRSQRVSIALWGLALPLHDPFRIAEDVATLDLLAPGRIVLIVNAGYREAEFIAHNQSFESRAAVFDEKLSLLLSAWTGEPVDVNGTAVVVTPRPATQPHPLLMIGGSRVEDAERAGAHGLPFRPSADDPLLRDRYRRACLESGYEASYLAPPGRVSIVQVADDPDEWWDAVGTHLLREARVYRSWMGPSERSAVHSRAETVTELREEGLYRVLTPAECVASARAEGSVLLHPLCGGTPLERAEQTVDLFVRNVLPELTR